MKKLFALIPAMLVTSAIIFYSCKKENANAHDAVYITCDNTERPKINVQLIPIGRLSSAREGMAVASTGNKILFAGGV